MSRLLTDLPWTYAVIGFLAGGCLGSSLAVLVVAWMNRDGERYRRDQRGDIERIRS